MLHRALHWAYMVLYTDCYIAPPSPVKRILHAPLLLANNYVGREVASGCQLIKGRGRVVPCKAARRPCKIVKTPSKSFMGLMNMLVGILLFYVLMYLLIQLMEGGEG